jgi:hypothetical protein
LCLERTGRSERMQGVRSHRVNFSQPLFPKRTTAKASNYGYPAFCEGISHRDFSLAASQ